MSSTAAGMASVCEAWPAGTSQPGRSWCRTGPLPMIQRRTEPERNAERRRLVGTATLMAAAALPIARGLGSESTREAAAHARPSAIVRTRAGKLRGFLDRDLMVFRGVRYGADTAPRRFMPPVAPAA